MANFDFFSTGSYTGSGTNPFHWGNSYDYNTPIRQVDKPLSRKQVQQENLQTIRQREVMKRGRK